MKLDKQGKGPMKLKKMQEEKDERHKTLPMNLRSAYNKSLIVACAKPTQQMYRVYNYCIESDIDR